MSTLKSIINEFPVLRDTLDLAEYHPDLKGNSVEVWLNLSDDFQERWRAYNADMAAHIEKAKKTREAEAKKAKTEAEKAKAKEILVIDMTDDLEQGRAELFAELWNLDVADAATLFDKTEAVGLLSWMRRRTWELIEEYATGRGEAVGG